MIFEALVRKRAGDELLLSDLPRRVLRREGGAAGGPAAATGAGDATVNAQVVARAIAERRFDLRRAVGDLERAALEAALAAAGGKRGGRGALARRASDAAARTIRAGPCAP